jgi:hypothetical protein
LFWRTCMYTFKFNNILSDNEILTYTCLLAHLLYPRNVTVCILLHFQLIYEISNRFLFQIITVWLCTFHCRYYLPLEWLSVCCLAPTNNFSTRYNTHPILIKFDYQHATYQTQLSTCHLSDTIINMSLIRHNYQHVTYQTQLSTCHLSDTMCLISDMLIIVSDKWHVDNCVW